MAEIERPDGLAGPRQARRIEDFDALYAAGTPAWDIGRPQPAFRVLADGGRLVGRVLDVGCGTGEHALMAAALGLDATGLDAATTAIAIAKRKADERGLTVQFMTWNALELADLGQSFDTVLDCGLFHVFEDSDRLKFVEGLRTCMPAGSRYYMLCFSDLEPGDWGPRRIRQDEIRLNFVDGWLVEAIEPSMIEITIDPGSARAWLASIARSG
jgi:SAM-dependent methyltransferase